MKKRIFTTALLSLVATFISPLSGAETDKSNMDDQTLLTQQTQDMRHGKVIMPAAGSRVQSGADAFLTADFLYWEARQGALEFAQTGIESSSIGNSRLPEGRTFEPDYQFDPGFRVGLGLGLGHDAWDLFVQYTWYHQNSQEVRISHPDNSLSTLRATPNMGFSTGVPLVDARGVWTMRLNVLDLELGRDSYFSKYLALRYFAGLKAAWQNHDFNVHYQWNDSANADALTNNKIKQNMKDFGIGLRAGLDGSWFFTRNWSIYGRFATSLLSTRARTNAKNQRFTSVNSSNVTEVENIEQKITFMEPIIELQMGFGWDMWFQDDTYHFGLKAGWENEVWINNSKFVTINESGSSENMSFQGFVLRARFDF